MCMKKDAVLNQMYQLMNKLQGLQQQAIQRIITHKALADAANQAWLDAESQYQTEVQAETNDHTLFQNELKLVSNDQSQVSGQQAHVAAVYANVTVASADAINDEAVIRLIISELSTLTAMPVPSPPKERGSEGFTSTRCKPSRRNPKRKLEIGRERRRTPHPPPPACARL